jgi:lambda family phage tail tape measure protein
MDKEILQAEQNILQAKLGLAGSNEEHLQIAIQLVQLEKTAKDKAIDEEVARAEREHAEHKITDAALQQVEAKARILKAENAAEAAAKLQAIVEEQLARAEQANFEIAVQKLKFQQDALHVADQLATTAEDHRRIQLQILASEIAQQRLELEHEKDLVIRNHGTKEEIDAIQQKIDNLPVQQAQGAALINANNRSPLDQWAHDVPKTAAEINQALQSIEVEGLDGLTDAIEKVITGTESMKDAFHELAASILADLLKMTIKMILFQALEAAMGGGGGGIPSPDLGGEMSVTGLNGGVAPSLPGGFASGGFVSGDGSSTSDSIPAMLSNGEYVMSAAAVRKFGVEMLDAINTGRLPHKRGGGIFGALKFVSPVAFLQSQGMLRYLSIPGTIADAFGVKGFASGGIVQGLPIPMIAMGNAAAPYRNTPMQPPVQVINNNDFRGADPSAVAAIKMHLDDLEASLPGKIVTTVRDAQQRFVLGGRR